MRRIWAGKAIQLEGRQSVRGKRLGSFVGKSWFGVADNARILVDYQFLLDKYSYNSDGGYDGKTYGYMTIYDAWKRGATIEVYSSKDNSKKLGTVPMYKDAADALGACGVDNAGTPDVTE